MLVYNIIYINIELNTIDYIINIMYYNIFKLKGLKFDGQWTYVMYLKIKKLFPFIFKSDIVFNEILSSNKKDT